MRMISKLLGAAALSTAVATSAGGATVPYDATGLTDYFDRLTDATKTIKGSPNLGQVRVTPEAGHAEGAPQVYAVRDENNQAQCMIGSHLERKSTAYTDEAFYGVLASKSLDALNPAMDVDIEDLTRNGAYAYPANTTQEDGFFRANAGFGIDKVVVFVDGEMLDLTSNVEPSNYNTKAEGALNDAIQSAYLSGKPVTYVTLSENGHTVVDTYQMDSSVIPTWNNCLETIEAIAIPQNDYVTFNSIPFPEATPEMIAEIKGSQCISGLRDKDIVGVRIIQSVTGAIIPFSYSLVLENGDEVVSDFFKKNAAGNMFLSESLTQFANHKIAACAGNVPVAQPPQLVTAFYPPSLDLTPVSPNTRLFPNVTPLFTTPTTPIVCCGGRRPITPVNPSPVPLPLGGLLLATALGGLAGLRRLNGPTVASGPL